jgi:C4-dicarboxylate-specific signal transduction histidine kinase
MGLAQFAFFGLMAAAFVAAVAAQGLLAAAEAHVALKHPALREALARQGMIPRLGGADARARRRLLRPLLFGGLTREAAADPDLAAIAGRVRLAMGVLVGSVAGMIAVVVLSQPAA